MQGTPERSAAGNVATSNWCGIAQGKRPHSRIVSAKPHPHHPGSFVFSRPRNPPPTSPGAQPRKFDSTLHVQFLKTRLFGLCSGSRRAWRMCVIETTLEVSLRVYRSSVVVQPVRPGRDKSVVRKQDALFQSLSGVSTSNQKRCADQRRPMLGTCAYRHSPDR